VTEKTITAVMENHCEPPGNHTCERGGPPEGGRKIPTGREERKGKEGDQEPDGQAAEASAEAEAAAAFARFWAVYPKRCAKLGAEAAFKAQLKAGYSAEAIIAGAKRYAVDAVRLARDARYTRDPRNWLRDGCWEDQDAGSPVVDQDGNIVAMPRPQRASGAFAIAERLIQQMNNRHNGGGGDE
jgi:hypothetical protein